MVKNNESKFKELRNTYQVFYYHGFDYTLSNKELSIEYHFSADNTLYFNPSLQFSSSPFFHFENVDKALLESLIFHIGMVELISYWKAMVPPVVRIEQYALNEEQIAFWKKIYFHGLGEYFWLNGIRTDYDSFLNIESSGHKLAPLSIENHSPGSIIPVGGGKDSIVTMEILAEDRKHNLALIMNPRGASSATADIGGYHDKTLIIKRRLDPLLLELNKQGFLNGHTPFSALLAFVTLLAAAATGKKYITLSNEGSANEPTVPGTKINHQYSKSLEFEEDFRNYVRHFITPDISYFSLLRPLSELQIASVFSRHPRYFMNFKSCNVGSKTDTWCGKCPKCLFTFIILSPFVDPKQLEQIFGANLLNDSELEQYFMELTGFSDIKPFECIGTVDEVNAALCLAREKYKTLPLLLNKHRQLVNNRQCEKTDREALLRNISREHFLAPPYLKLLHKALEL